MAVFMGDYFIASSATHGRYWIYRERPTADLGHARRWFLHGLFA